MRKVYPALISIFMVVIILSSFKIASNYSSENSDWKAPAEADTLTNPYKNDKDAWMEAESTFNNLCSICHGYKGLGDGMAGMALDPRPANFTLDRVQKQSDGAIFWKMTNGRPPMASYRETLSADQRWQLVSYIRHLAKK